MKNMKHYLAYCAVFALLLAGCSKDEKAGINADPDTTKFVDLSFSALLNDLSNDSRASADLNKNHFSQIPECSDAIPDYVVLEISYDGQAAETEGPITIDILSDGTEYFTDYSELLKVPVPDGGAVSVSLDSFEVFDADDNKIWVAPMGQADFAGYVDQALPQVFQVRDGTKPYIDVEVLCYDDRMVNEYGYVFFDIEGKELIEFCVFGNFCPPTSGRHYVASYSLNVWIYEDGQATDQIYNGEETRRLVTENSAGEWAADPLCIVLPDDPDVEDQYLVEITILDGPNYDATEEVIRTSVLTDEEVRTFFDGDDNLEYFHFFEGCGQDDNPPIFDDPRDDRMTYKTCLKGLNDSGVIALAAASIEGNDLSVTILATGMETGMQHLQHIHGKDGEDAVCPPESASGDDDIITLAEGLPFYGGVQLPLELIGGGFPTPDGMGNYIYQRTFPLSDEQKTNLSPLDHKVIVLHGVTDDPSLPVACGELEKVDP